MIKNIFFSFLLISIFSCSKNNNENSLDEETYTPPKYDTMAIDSFSSGAVSVDVAAQIRQSSVAYQDSIAKVKLAEELAKKELEIKQKSEAVEKEKLEPEKKKLKEPEAVKNEE